MLKYAYFILSSSILGAATLLRRVCVTCAYVSPLTLLGWHLSTSKQCTRSSPNSADEGYTMHIDLTTLLSSVSVLHSRS